MPLAHAAAGDKGPDDDPSGVEPDAKLAPRTAQALEVGVHMRPIIIEAMQSTPASRLRARVRGR